MSQDRTRPNSMLRDPLFCRPLLSLIISILVSQPLLLTYSFNTCSLNLARALEPCMSTWGRPRGLVQEISCANLQVLIPMSSYLSSCFLNTLEQKQIDIFRWISGRKKTFFFVQLSVRFVCVHFCRLNFYTRFLHMEQYTQHHHITDMPRRIPPDNILLQTFFNYQQQQQSTKHTHTTTTLTQQHWMLTITSTMVGTPTKCKKKDNNVVIKHQPNAKKVAAKLYNTTQQPTTPMTHRWAPMAPAHLRPGLAVTTTPTAPRRQVHHQGRGRWRQC